MRHSESKTIQCTPYMHQSLNHSINQPTARGAFYLVDLPGVGYAKVPKPQRQAWLSFMKDYLYDRPTLKVINQIKYVTKATNVSN